MPEIDNKPVSISLSGGLFPNEDGTWRVCCWLSNITSEQEAAKISQWLGNLIKANIKPAEAPPPPV